MSLHPCVKPELVRPIICDPFESGLPHLVQNTLVKSTAVLGWLTLTFKASFNFEVKSLLCLASPPDSHEYLTCFTVSTLCTVYWSGQPGVSRRIMSLVWNTLYLIVVVVVNFISDRQYKNKDNLLTKQDTTLVIAVRGHQRSPWAHRAGGPVSSHVHQATQGWAGEAWNNETQLAIEVHSGDTDKIF